MKRAILPSVGFFVSVFLNAAHIQRVNIHLDLYHAAVILSPRGTKSFVLALNERLDVQNLLLEHCVIKVYWQVFIRAEILKAVIFHCLGI